MKATLFLLLGVLAIPVTGAAPSRAGETLTSPIYLLEDLENAYANRDIDAYRNLLAEDFQFISENSIGDGTWRRDQDLAGTTMLFENERILSVRLTLDVRSVEPAPPGNGGMTMVTAGSLLRVTQAGAGPEDPPQEIQVEGESTFYLRRGHTPKEARTGGERGLAIVVWQSI